MSEHLKYPTEANGPIPSFSSYEEEAAWWDETDTGAPEIEAVLTPLTLRAAKGYTKHMMLRIDEKTDNQLEQEAQKRGVKKSTLVRMVVTEWLRHHERHAS